MQIVGAVLRYDFDDRPRAVAILRRIRADLDLHLFYGFFIRRKHCSAAPSLAVGAYTVEVIAIGLDPLPVRADLHRIFVRDATSIRSADTAVVRQVHGISADSARTGAQSAGGSPQ